MGVSGIRVTVKLHSQQFLGAIGDGLVSVRGGFPRFP